MSKITPCLWFASAGEEAANFYVSLLPDSRIDKVMKSPADNPSGKAGDVLVVEFTLAGQSFMALNGGPMFTPNEAVSFSVACEDQAEVDRLWDALTADGGQPSQCGWLKDRWGFAWQITPKRLPELLAHPDPKTSKRVMEAMLQMGKIEVSVLEAAAEGR